MTKIIYCFFVGVSDLFLSTIKYLKIGLKYVIGTILTLLWVNIVPFLCIANIGHERVYKKRLPENIYPDKQEFPLTMFLGCMFIFCELFNLGALILQHYGIISARE